MNFPFFMYRLIVSNGMESDVVAFGCCYSKTDGIRLIRLLLNFFLYFLKVHTRIPCNFCFVYFSFPILFRLLVGMQNRWNGKNTFRISRLILQKEWPWGCFLSNFDSEFFGIWEYQGCEVFMGECLLGSLTQKLNHTQSTI